MARGSVVAAARILVGVDKSQVAPGLRAAEAEVQGFGQRAQHSFSLLGTAAKAAAVGGVGLLVVGVKDSIKAAEAQQVVMAKLQVALRNAGLSWTDNRDRIQETLTKQAEVSGFMRTDLADSFANMIRTTKNVNDALRLNAIAADIARTKGMDLGQAQSLLARVYNGSFIGLKKLGIAVDQVTTSQDALKAAHQKYTPEQLAAAKADDKRTTATNALALVQKTFAGQAEAYGKTAAGAQDRFRVALEEVQASIGKGLLPIVTSMMNKLTSWIERLNKSKEAHKQLSDAAHTVGKILQGVIDAVGTILPLLKRLADFVNTVVTKTIGWKNAIIALLAVWTGAKLATALGGIAKLVGAEAAIGTTAQASALKAEAAMGGIGTSASLAAGPRGLGKVLGGLNKIALAAAAGYAVKLVIDTYVVPHIPSSGPIRAAWNLISGGGTGIAAFTPIAPAVWGLKSAYDWATGGGSSPSAQAAAERAWTLSHTTSGGGGSTSFTPGLGGLTQGSGGSVSIPSGSGVASHATHQTAGLSGYPAIDYMAAAGTRILAPEDGFISDGRTPGLREPHFIPWDRAKRVGGWTIYYVGNQSGDIWFMTHLDAHGGAGSYRKGAVIGTVAAVPGGWWGSHVHVGEHVGGGTYSPPAGRGVVSGGAPGATSGAGAGPGAGAGASGSGAAVYKSVLTRAFNIAPLQALGINVAAATQIAANYAKQAGIATKLIYTAAANAVAGVINTVIKATQVKGASAAVGAYDQASSGVKWGTENVGGKMVRILVPFTPGIKEWTTIRTNLLLKLKAAYERRAALMATLKKALSQRLKSPQLATAIANLRAALAATNALINDKLLPDIKDAAINIATLQATAQSDAQKKAQEDEAAAKQAQADQIANQVLLNQGDTQAQIDAENSLAGILGHSPSAAEWEAAYPGQPLPPDLAPATGGSSGGTGTGGTGTGTSTDPSGPSIYEQMAAFLAHTRELRNFENTIIGHSRPGGGHQPRSVNVTNYYLTQPDDPHLWSRSLNYELQAMGG